MIKTVLEFYLQTVLNCRRARKKMFVLDFVKLRKIRLFLDATCALMSHCVIRQKKQRWRKRRDYKGLYQED